ncbi:MAG: sugar transferase [Thermoguttaceae bacterium]|jgi:lipopolysaccharide/colanic/teichoic acid biosynthesis glycosyltransferase
MKQILERERTRADRMGEGFSLLMLSLAGERPKRAAAAHVARILEQRLRATDDAGWLNRWRVGIVLPATTPPGAWKVAGDIQKDLPRDLPVEVAVLYYPSDFPPPRELIGESHAQGAGRPQSVSPMEPVFTQRLPFAKRCLDVVGAVGLLLLLAPLLAMTAICIKLTSPGPVLFKQQRSGRGGRPFLLYKFRSMVVDAEAKKQELMQWNEQDGPAFKIRNDPRVTRLGRFLRQTSIDELPQLWNVVRGDMSLVGPRPLVCNETAACRGWERRRLDVTPGLTCTWQVKGGSRVSFADWVRMDIRYIRSRSLRCDVKLLLQTLPAVVLRKNK